MFDPDRDRLRCALALFSDGILGERHALITVFESLGNELQLRAMAFRHREPQSAILSHANQLARLFTYASFRFTELIIRLEQLNWMQREFCTKSGDEAAPWHNFAALAIKDFHLDIGSLMDATAPAILQVAEGFDAEGQQKLPGFADVQLNGSPRSPKFRESMSQNLLKVVDSTDRWWLPVKRMRDELAHREHNKIVFAGAEQGVLFQIYTSAFAPVLVHPSVLWKHGQNVADFRLYSAAVLSEMFVFLDDLGRCLAAQLKMSVNSLTPSMRVGDFTYLVEPMQELLTAVDVAS